MTQKPVTLLGYALLGLLHQKASSGYDLRKVFSNTPMGTYSDSPGAIYPALRRLEQDGLIRGDEKESAGLRRRRLFRLTAAGSKELRRWLELPITQSDLMRGAPDLMLRFAFMESTLDAPAAITFLKALRKELNTYIPTLKGHLQTHGAKMPLSGMLALDSGVRGYEALLDWAEYAISMYSRKEKRGARRTMAVPHRASNRYL